LFVAKEIFSKLKLKWNITSFNLKPYTLIFDEFKVPYQPRNTMGSFVFRAIEALFVA